MSPVIRAIYGRVYFGTGGRGIMVNGQPGFQTRSDPLLQPVKVDCCMRRLDCFELSTRGYWIRRHGFFKLVPGLKRRPLDRFSHQANRSSQACRLILHSPIQGVAER